MTSLEKPEPPKCPACTRINGEHPEWCRDTFHKTPAPSSSPLETPSLEADFCVCDYRPRRKCSVHLAESSAESPKKATDEELLERQRSVIVELRLEKNELREQAIMALRKATGKAFIECEKLLADAFLATPSPEPPRQTASQRYEVYFNGEFVCKLDDYLDRAKKEWEIARTIAAAPSSHSEKETL